MKPNFLAVIGIAAYSIMLSAYAGTDPISWAVSPSTGIPSQTYVGSSYAVTYTLTNNLPTAIPITILESYTGSTFSVTNTCNSTLARSGTCTIQVGLQPASAQSMSESLVIVYGNTKIPLPAIRTSAVPPTLGQTLGTFVTQPLPPNAQVGTAYPVTFTFFNTAGTSVTATSVTPSGFPPSSSTCTAAIAGNALCEVQGTFTPTSVGQSTLSVSYDYNSSGPKTATSSTSTNVVAAGASCVQLAAATPLPLPASTYIYSDNIVRFTFTNHCDATSQTLGNVTLSATLNGVAANSFYTKGTVAGMNDTCSGVTLAANASCQVYVSLLPTQTGQVALKASVPYNAGANIAEAITTEQVQAIPNQATDHTIEFVNQCSYPVWYGFSNGSGGTLSPDPTPTGLRGPNNYRLVAALSGKSPATTILSFPVYKNGSIYPRTNCTVVSNQLVCQSASCNTLPFTGTCVETGAVGNGAQVPYTKLEQFMPATTNADGVYDVSTINGFNVPVEYKGLGPITGTFSCTAAGAPIQPTGSTLGACSWSFSPPSTGIDSVTHYTWVSEGANDGCTSSSSCSANEFCGTSYNATDSTGGEAPLNRRCGAFIGYWTIAQFAGFPLAGQWGPTANLYTTYTLGTSLPAGPQGSYGSIIDSNPVTAANYASLYKCLPTSNNSLRSGYDTGINVCGCYDWNQTDSVAKTAQSSQCQKFNSDWTNTAFNRVSWIKTACPTAYTYQFDDKSSSFSCNQVGKRTSYQIVFCPAGKTGTPA